jgi:hypothetical protein
MGERLKFKVRPLSPSAIKDAWLRRATAVAIEQARAVVSGGAVSPNTPVGRLSEVEWGWIVAAILFGWIGTRAEQATSTGLGVEESIGGVNLDPDPWDAGAIAAILPELAASDIDWSKPLADLSRDDMIAFLTDALGLIRKAMAARDRGTGLVTRHTPAGNTGRGRRPADDAGRAQRPDRCLLRQHACPTSTHPTVPPNRSASRSTR